MFKIKWDIENNGIIFDDKTPEKDVIVPPRPVFYEELDLLGFNEFWKYPKSKEPLLWSKGREYWYKGIKVAEANGGNIFKDPVVTLTKESENLTLKPINLKKIISINRKAIDILEGEAIDFVKKSHDKYKNKVDFFAVAFSGGKDSQVVLDIVSRILPPNNYIVVFYDTTMELVDTYNIVKTTKEEYQKLYPELRFYTAKPHKKAIEFWDEFGVPSRMQRWCCSVTKTVPFSNLLNQLYKAKGYERQPKILVYEGVRSAESRRRSEYDKTASGGKHTNIINSRVVFDWNSTEIYLYLFAREKKLNNSYRLGFHRVGCLICPMSSDWSEFLMNKIHPDSTKPYLDKIRKLANNIGITDEFKINEYIAHENWKKRAGCKSVNMGNTRLEFIEKKSDLIAVLTNPKEDFFEWLKVAGDVLIGNDCELEIGELKMNNEIVEFIVESSEDNKIVIKLINIVGNILVKSKLKKILYKTAYCSHCKACEVECKFNAITVFPFVKINTDLCTHCYKCIDFTDKGCLKAKSINLPSSNSTMKSKSSGIDRYSTFGLRKEWLDDYLTNPNEWILNNNLGPKQVPAVKWWLKEAGLISMDKNIPTEITKFFKEFKTKNYDSIWQLLWVNLYYGSIVIKWYTDLVPFTKYQKKLLKEKIKDDFPGYAAGTVENPLDALVNMFDRSPLGNKLRLGALIKKGNVVQTVEKLGTDEIHPLTIAYSLYKCAEHQKRYDFTVSEFFQETFEGGPYKLFGISRDKFENSLRSLENIKEHIVRIDIKANLENIFLREDLKPIDILKLVLNSL